MSAKQYFFNDLVFDYLDFLKNIKGLSENTAKAYHRDLSKFSKFLESIAINCLEHITEEICSAWVADLFQNNVSARSIQRHISSAKGFFSYMKKISLVQSSPFELINSPKFPNRLPNVLSPEEVSKLLNFKPTSD